MRIDNPNIIGDVSVSGNLNISGDISSPTLQTALDGYATGGSIPPGTLDGYVTSVQGADGYVAFFTDAYGGIAGDNDLFWDRANNRLGIGTSSPTKTLTVHGAAAIDGDPTYASGIQTFTINPTNTSSWQVVPPTNAGTWGSVTLSYDGSRQYAAKNYMGGGNMLYTSTDSGATWSAIGDGGGSASNLIYYSVDCDSDGSFITMTSSSSSVGIQGLWISSNYGGSWTYVVAPAGYYQKFYWAGCNNDGSRVIALRDSNMFYVSTDSGTNWSGARYLPSSYAPAKSYGINTGACAMSSTGTYLAVVALGSGGYPTIYVSTDSGSTWGSGYTISGASANDSCCIAMDADGSHIVAVVAHTGINAVCISTNYGASWTASAGPSSSYHYISVAMSDDGERIVLGTSSSNNGYVYVSNNAGSSWTQQSTGVATSANWYAVGISGDSSNITCLHTASGNSIANNSPTTKFVIGNTAVTSLNYAIGGNLTTTLDNIVTYVNNQGSRNINATKTSGTQITYTAASPGTAGNSLVTTHSKDGDNVYSFGGTTLSGGLDAGGLITSNGYINIGQSLVTPTTGYGDVGDVVTAGDLEVKGNLKVAGTMSAAGADGYVQYNNGGPFGAATGLYYDDVGQRVGIGITSPTASLHVRAPGSSSAFFNGGRVGVGLDPSTNIGIANNPLVSAIATGAGGDFWHNTNIACVDTRSNANGVGGGISFLGKDSGQNYYYLGGFRGFFSTADNAGGMDLFARGSGIRFFTAGSLIIDSGTPNALMDKNGNWGLGTTTPKNRLDVEGAAAIGASYSGTNTAPSNGLLVEGKIGIGPSGAAGTWPSSNAYIDVNYSGSATTAGILVRAGGYSPSIAFGWYNTDAYRHTIYTRHSSSVDANNAIDFYVWNTSVGTYNNPTKNVMTLEGDGKVGIGTTSPGSYLAVVGNATIGSSWGASAGPTDGIMVQGKAMVGISSSWPSSAIGINRATSSSTYDIYFAPTGDTVCAMQSSGGGLWITNINDSWSEILLNGGGSLSWDKQVQISYSAGTVGAGAGEMIFGQTSKNAGTFTHGITRFYTNGIERLRINAAGYVGINNASPSASLDVIGDLEINGNIWNPALKAALDGYDSSLSDLQRINSQQSDWNTTVLVALDGYGSGGGTPSGADGYLQYNNGGAFGGAILYYDDSTGRLGVGTTTPETILHVASQGDPVAPNTAEITIQSLAGTNAHTDIAFRNINNDYVGDIGIHHDSGEYYIGNYLNNSGYISFYTTSDGADHERLRITNNGKIGVGTATPATTVHFADDDGAHTMELTLQCLSQNTSQAGYADIAFLDGYSDYIGDIGMKLVGSDQKYYLDNWSTGPFSFVTSAGEVMNIQQDGKVGLGAAAPTTQLHIAGNQGGGTELTLQGLGAGSAWADIAFLNENGDYMGDIGLSMGSDTNFYVSNQNNNTGFYTFYTKTGGSLYPRLTITNTGNIGIGNASPPNKLSVVGDGYFDGYAAAKRIYVNGSIINTIDWSSSGWGSGSSITATTGNDSRGTVSITSGTSPSANPTVTLTFKDGAWTSAPFAMSKLISPTDSLMTPITESTTTTSLTLTFVGTPQGSTVYIIKYLIVG